MIPAMAVRLEPNEELHLIVSPKSRKLYEVPGGNVRYLTFPWSNEHRNLRTLSEHVYSPLRSPLSHIDVLNTLMAPVVNPTWSLVVHMKTMHAFTTPEALSGAARLYRRMNYPLSPPCRRHNHKLRKPSLGHPEVHGGRPGQVQVDPGGSGP